MGSRVAFAPALHGIRAAAYRAAEEDGGVEHAHPLITERVAEFLRADQRGQQRHLRNLPGINVCYHGRKINPPGETWKGHLSSHVAARGPACPGVESAIGGLRGNTGDGDATHAPHRATSPDAMTPCGAKGQEERAPSRRSARLAARGATAHVPRRSDVRRVDDARSRRCERVPSAHLYAEASVPIRDQQLPGLP